MNWHNLNGEEYGIENYNLKDYNYNEEKRKF